MIYLLKYIYRILKNKISYLIKNKFYDDDNFNLVWSCDNLIGNLDTNYAISRDGNGTKSYILRIDVFKDDGNLNNYFIKNINTKYKFEIVNNMIESVDVNFESETPIRFAYYRLSPTLRKNLLREIKLLATRKLINSISNNTISNSNKKSTFKLIKSLPILDNVEQYSILFDELPNDSNNYSSSNNYSLDKFDSGISLTPTPERECVIYNNTSNDKIKEIVSDFKYGTNKGSFFPEYAVKHNNEYVVFTSLLESLKTVLANKYVKFKPNNTFTTNNGHVLCRRIMFQMNDSLIDKYHNTIKFIQFDIDPSMIRIKVHTKYDIAQLPNTIKYGMTNILVGTEPPEDIELAINTILYDNKILLNTKMDNLFFHTASV